MGIPAELEGVILSDPEVMGGAPCFKGTRVPLETFLDYVEEGYSLERFLQGYSSVGQEQAVSVLRWFGRQSRRAAGLELL